MKRLNNNGWGLERMLILLSLMIFILLVVVIMVYRVYWVENIDLINGEYIVERK